MSPAKSILSLSLLLASLSGCVNEEAYQKDADAERIADFRYYTDLLDLYHDKTDSYPLTDLHGDRDLYVIIIDGDTPDWIMQANPYVDYYEDDVFFAAIESQLGEPVEHRYDPQNVAEGSRPIFYIYSINNSHVGFTVHLYSETPDTIKVAEHYYKLEGFKAL